MPRYIDAEKLEPDTEWSDYFDGFVSYSKRQIKDTPTADVRENRRGKWIWEEVDCMDGIHKYHQVRCSCCGERFISEVNFCPNCGADMREGEDARTY